MTAVNFDLCHVHHRGGTQGIPHDLAAFSLSRITSNFNAEHGETGQNQTGSKLIAAKLNLKDHAQRQEGAGCAHAKPCQPWCSASISDYNCSAAAPDCPQE